MQVLSYIIKIFLLPLGRLQAALLNTLSLFIVIRNATLGSVIPERLLHSDVQSLTSFWVVLQNVSLSWLPGCGNASLFLFIIGNNLFPRSTSVSLTIKFRKGELPKVLSCVGTSALAFKTPFQPCFDFSD